MNENIRLAFRQSPRGAWTYFKGMYHTCTRAAFDRAMADARRWGFVCPTRMAAAWGCSERQARRISSLKWGTPGIDYVEIIQYQAKTQKKIIRRLWLLYPDMIPKDWLNLYITSLDVPDYEGTFDHFWAIMARNFERLEARDEKKAAECRKTAKGAEE